MARTAELCTKYRSIPQGILKSGEPLGKRRTCIYLGVGTCFMVQSRVPKRGGGVGGQSIAERTGAQVLYSRLGLDRVLWRGLSCRQGGAGAENSELSPRGPRRLGGRNPGACSRRGAG